MHPDMQLTLLQLHFMVQLVILFSPTLNQPCLQSLGLAVPTLNPTYLEYNTFDCIIIVALLGTASSRQYYSLTH